jgi:V/A-type H+-transporting ATPase subunit C
MVQREIDVVNLVTLLRVSREGLTAEECRTFYIPGGKVVAERLFGRLAGQRVESLVEGLRGTPYGELLGAALPQFKERGTVSLLERKLEEYLVTQAVALFRGDLLSSAVMIAYLQAKFNELVNLRLLARGKEAKLPEATIREALILV